jgi:hypothetical protein
MDDSAEHSARLERRTSIRFPVELAVRYWVLGSSHRAPVFRGTTRNISSRGILFTATQNIVPRSRVELVVDWPGQVSGKLPLKLIIQGRVFEWKRTPQRWLP